MPSGPAELAVQISQIEIKSSAGTKTTLAFPFISDEDILTLAELQNALTSNANLPADADSLLFDIKLYSREAGTLKVNPQSALSVSFELSDNQSPLITLPTVVLTDNGQFRYQARASIPLKAWVNRSVQLRPLLANFKMPNLQGALVHIYEFGRFSVEKSVISRQNMITDRTLKLQIHPNPFNPSTQIHFAMKESGPAKLRIYNLNGQLVRELLNELRGTGEYTVPWDGRDARGVAAASGIYYIRFETGKEVKFARGMLIR